jgi:predicted ATPase/DNA-binding SARP family transcriptional activator/Tfp pilus assembly protein PilF
MGDAGELEFLLLGPVEARRGEVVVPLGGPRQRTLLALLLLRPGRIVGVDELLDAIWYGEPPDGAATTIRSYISRLRAALGSAARIAGNSEGYSISVSPDAIDLLRFEGEVRAADAELRSGMWRAAADRLAPALALWRGRPFGDLADDGPLRLAADRLVELRIHALEQRVEADIRLGRSADLVDELEGLVGQYPYRERLWSQLMRALYHSGRQADALTTYQRARTMLDDQLGIEPSPDLQELEGSILRQELDPIAAQGRTSNLPGEATPLIGREADIATLERLISSNRLVTLTGVGGVGKTSLALAVARAGTIPSPDGQVFVDLVPVADGTGVARAVMRALDVHERPSQDVTEQLTSALRNAAVLIILDNCEHVIASAAEISEAIIRSCPDVRIVATSRMPLGISGEVEHGVSPLKAPSSSASIDELRSSEAVRLLLERAYPGRTEPFADDTTLGAAARICRDLDGLPLAIELAAARARALSLSEIAGRLDDRFRFLVSWRRVSAGRHQTLKQAMDWSYDLLSPTDQVVFAQLSVFVGGFRLPAASAITRPEATGEDGALDAVTRLVDASLVVAEPRGTATRYRQLETVRQYGANRLEEMGGADTARRRYATYFMDLAEHAEPELSGDAQTRWFTLLDEEHDNLLTALSHMADAADNASSLLSFTVSLTRFWYVRGYLGEARDRLEQAVQAAADAPVALRRRALTATASIALLQGDYGAATRFAEASLDAARETGEDRLVANGLSNLGAIVLAAGDRARAGGLLREAVALARSVDDSRILALALNNLGDHALTIGEYERAEPLFTESLAILEKRGDTANVARSLFNLGAVALRRGRIDDADERLRLSLERGRDAGDKEDLSWALLGMAAVCAARGDGRRAAVVLAAAKALLDGMGADFKPFERQLYEETDQQLEDALDAATRAGLREQGRMMSIEDAVAFATQR